MGNMVMNVFVTLSLLIIKLAAFFWMMFAFILQYFVPFNLVFFVYDVFIASDGLLLCFFYRRFKLPEGMGHQAFRDFNSLIYFIIATIINLMHWDVAKPMMLAYFHKMFW